MKKQIKFIPVQIGETDVEGKEPQPVYASLNAEKFKALGPEKAKAQLRQDIKNGAFAPHLTDKTPDNVVNDWLDKAYASFQPKEDSQGIHVEVIPNDQPE